MARVTVVLLRVPTCTTTRGSCGFASCSGCTLSLRGVLFRGRVSGYGKRFSARWTGGRRRKRSNRDSVTSTKSSASQGDGGFLRKCWPLTALQAALRRWGCSWATKNAPDEFGTVFQGAIDNWQEKVTEENGGIFGCSPYEERERFCGVTLFVHDVLEKGLLDVGTADRLRAYCWQENGCC